MDYTNVQTTTKCSNYHTIALISHVNKIILNSKIMLKILQARLQQYMNQDLLDVKAWFRNIRGTRDQFANIYWIIEKAREFQKKTSTSALWTMLKPLTLWITPNGRKFLKEVGIPDCLTCLLRSCMQVRKEQLEVDMEQSTGSKLGKMYIRLDTFTLLIELLCRVYHEKCWAAWSTSWNQDRREKYQ